MAKRLCLSSEDMTLVEAAARDEYREMGIEEEQKALAPVPRSQHWLPPAIGRPTPATKPAIREPQRKTQPVPPSTTAAPATASNGSPKTNYQDSGAMNGNDSATTLQGVVGRSIPTPRAVPFVIRARVRSTWCSRSATTAR